jgi:surface polysaccharide O-acyltransferase-like enzyme
MVVVQHAAASTFFDFSSRWWASNVYYSFTRVAVPLFFMVSGATLLSKQEPIAAFLRKRLARVLPPLIFWSVFYLVARRRSVGEWIPDILTGGVSFHFWYLYAILGLYALVPVFRPFYRNAAPIDLAYVLALWFCVASLYDTLNARSAFSRDHVHMLSLQAFSGYFGYFVLGAMLRDRARPAVGRRRLAVGVILFAAGGALTALLTWHHSLAVGAPSELYARYRSPFVVMAAVGAYLALLSLPGAKGIGGRLTGALAGCSLGIYCLHVILLYRLAPYVDFFSPARSGWLWIPTFSLVVLSLSFAIVLLMRRVSALRYVT